MRLELKGRVLEESARRSGKSRFKFSKGRQLIHGRPQRKLLDGLVIRLMGAEQLQQTLALFHEFRLAGGGCQRTGELDG